MVYGAMLAKSCATSHGQPPTGSRKRAMIVSRRAISSLRSVMQPLPPWQVGIAQGDEIRVEQRVLAVVAQRLAVHAKHHAPGRFQHALRGGGVPLAGGAETRVDRKRTRLKSS